MNLSEINQLKQEVYALWYNETNEAKKQTLKKTLDLIEFAEKALSKLQYISNYFSSML